MTRMSFAILRVEEWPQQDALRWLKAREPRAKLFAERSAADWRLTTATKAEEGYGMYLHWLADRGFLDHAVTMEQRVTHEAIQQFASEYAEGRAPLTVAGTVRDIALVLRACSPPHGVKWLTDLSWRAMNASKPIRPKLPHIASPGALYGLGKMLMTEGRWHGDGKSWSGARMYRDGLMIACLAVRPLRLGEHMALRLGHTLTREGERWHIAVPPSSTKTNRWRRDSFPAFLTPAMDYYVEQVRSVLPREKADLDDGWFWLGTDGRLNPSTVSSTISRLTLKRLGKAVSPHRFRDSAATAIALEMPKHIGITKSVLGHASLQTSQDHYNQAHSFSASAELAEVVEELRRSA